MNEIFDIRRFGKYFAAEAKRFIANYGLSILAISLMGVIIVVVAGIWRLILTGEWGGAGVGLRIFTFLVSIAAMMITMPIRCYGRITEKKFGTEWLMLPVSRFEKLLSMIILSAVIVPVTTCVVYLSLDALICLIDPTCEISIVGEYRILVDQLVAMPESLWIDMSQHPDLEAFIRNVSSPWLYLDNFIGMMLVFLCGAVIFKKNKTVKTILSYTALSTVVGSIFIPLALVIFSKSSPEALTIDPTINDMMNHFMLKHAVLLDTLKDTCVNLAVIGAIYWRIKTIKH